MSALDVFLSFQPLRNPIGFGARDFIELAAGALLVVLSLAWRPWIAPLARGLATRTAWCMLLLALLPVALRLLLLPHHPIPSPQIYDEFGHLLVADTLRHFRLANPPHALPQFFETFFVLQQPAYASIYPIGQGLVLALGRAIFGHPWAGVVLSVAAFCSLCYWMLRAWTTPEWALLGGMLAVAEFGPLNQWMNNYWGGAVPAAAGCLVFGSLPRLREAPSRMLYAVLLGIGLALHVLTRQYETIFLATSVVLYFLPELRNRNEWRTLARAVPAVALPALGAIGLTLMQNQQVTGSWTTLPAMLSQYQYGVPASLTFQAHAVPHRELTQQQELDYKMQRSFRGSAPETIGTYLLRLEYRVRYYRFFFLVPLYLTLPAFLVSIRDSRFAWAALSLVIFALGVNFFPAFQFHYVAAIVCLFVLASVTGLERLSRLTVRGVPVGRTVARLIVFICAAHFLFWYGLHLFDDQPFSLAMRQYETWNGIDHGDPGGRVAVQEQLARAPGKHLVFVRYWPQHIFQQEWVYNAADIDGASIVWARDLGAAEDEKLRQYYPNRAVWLLEPDGRPPKLTPCDAAATCLSSGPSPGLSSGTPFESP
jgi:hypothetical protein